MSKGKRTIAFDFDNVIHKYRDEWKDGSVYDDLNHDILNMIRELMDDGHKVFIMSTRSRFQIRRHFDKINTMHDIKQDMSLDANKIPFDYETFWRFKIFWNKSGVCGICNHKAVFDVLVDDRALRFDPEAPPAKEELIAFRPIPYK